MNVVSATSLSDADTATGVLQFAAGFVLGLCADALRRRLGRRAGKPHTTAASRALASSSDDDDDDDDEEEDVDNVGLNPVQAGSSREPHKLVLCVRTDLRMQKGKIAAQVGHATLGAFKACARLRPDTLRVWENNAQPKIAVQVPSRQMVTQLQQTARRLGLTTYVVYDAGRTQIAAGSMTVLAVGPGPASAINQVTGSLKLL